MDARSLAAAAKPHSGLLVLGLGNNPLPIEFRQRYTCKVQVVGAMDETLKQRRGPVVAIFSPNLGKLPTAWNPDLLFR